MLLYTYSKNLLNKELNTIMEKKDLEALIKDLQNEIEEKDSIIDQVMGVNRWLEMKLKEAWIKIGDEDEDECTC